MERKKYSGVVVPMVTPLTEQRGVDTDAVKKIVTSFSDNRISPLVLGTTGESSSFTMKEGEELVKAAVASKGSEQPVYVGLVGNNVEQLIESGRRYFDLGADVAVATLPSYYILTADQMIGFYENLADNLPGPLMMYNIKATTQMTIPLEVVDRLSRHENILGLKDSERDEERLKKCIETYKERKDFSFFCGWGAQSANSLMWGADGIVPSTGNFVPASYNKLYEAALRGDMKEAARLQAETDEIAGIYQGGRTLGLSLAALKILMGLKELCQPFMKPPLTELSEEELNKIETAAKAYLEQN